MRDGKVLIYTRQEWKNKVTEAYKDLLLDIADDLLRAGNELIPDCIISHGIDGLSDEELVNVMEFNMDLINEELLEHEYVACYFENNNNGLKFVTFVEVGG